MPTTYWKVDALKDIIQELAKQQRAQEALHIISQAKEAALGEVDPVYLQYSQYKNLLELAEAQWTARDKQGARLSIQQAIESFEGRPDEDALGRELFFMHVAELYARMGDKENMLATAQRIPIDGDRDMLLRAAAEAQAESGDTQGALETVAMIKGWQREFALYHIARLQAKAGDIRAARDTITAITEHMMWKCFALTHIAEAQSAISDGTAAVRTVGEAERLARTIPDIHERAETFGVIAQIQAKLGDTEGATAIIQAALALVEQIKDSGPRDRALGEVARAEISIGDINGALKLAEAMEPSFRRFRMNREIAEAQARAGDYSGAVQTAQKSHPGSEGLWRASTFHLIARIQAEQGQVHEAEEWAVNLRFHTDTAWALLGIADGLIARGKAKR